MRSHTYTLRMFPKFLRRFLPILLVIAMMSMLVIPTAQALSLRSIYDFAKNSLEDINCIITPGCGLIDQVGEETRATLRAAAEEIEQLIKLLDEVYKDNLDFTLDKLDDFTRRKLNEVEDLLLTLNEALQDDIKLISGEINATIDNIGEELRLTINEIEDSVEDIIIVALEGAVYFIDRTTLNIVTVVSIILLGIGLIVFASLLFNARKEPSSLRKLGIGLMFVHILFFGALTLSADFRSRIIISTQLGLRETIELNAQRPEIQVIQPDPLDLTTDQRLHILGSHLLVNDEPPEVRLDNQILPIIAVEDKRLILDTTNLNLGNNVTTNVDLIYPDPTLNLTRIISVNEVVPQPRRFPVSLTVTLMNARFPSNLARFFATPQVRLLANGEADAISGFFESGKNVKPNGLQTTVSVTEDEIIEVRLTLSGGPVVEVDSFDLDWVGMEDCDGNGKCTFTHETDARLQGENLEFTVTYCMTVRRNTRFGGVGGTTFGDLCNPNPPVLTD